MESEIGKLLAVLLVGTMVTVGTVEAAYVQTGPDTDVLVDDPPDVQTSTKLEYTDVDTDAEDWGYCHCSVYTRAWATAVDTATTDAIGEPYWQISWEWEGAGTPPGGTLTWQIDADGRTDAWGITDPGNAGSAYSHAEASSVAWLSHAFDPNFGGATATGTVTDNNTGSANGTPTGSAEWDGTPYQNTGNGYYEFFSKWKLYMDEDVDDTIESGTSYIQVLAGAYCHGYGRATATGTGSQSEALAETYTIGDAWLQASFTSN